MHTAYYNANPPNYDDPSVADDILSLLRTALAVRDGLSNATDELESLDEISETGLLPKLREVDEVWPSWRAHFSFAQTTFAGIFQALERISHISEPLIRCHPRFTIFST